MVKIREIPESSAVFKKPHKAQSGGGYKKASKYGAAFLRGNAFPAIVEAIGSVAGPQAAPWLNAAYQVSTGLAGGEGRDLDFSRYAPPKFQPWSGPTAYQEGGMGRPMGGETATNQGLSAMRIRSSSVTEMDPRNEQLFNPSEQVPRYMPTPGSSFRNQQFSSGMVNGNNGWRGAPGFWGRTGPYMTGQSAPGHYGEAAMTRDIQPAFPNIYTPSTGGVGVDIWGQRAYNPDYLEQNETDWANYEANYGPMF